VRGFYLADKGEARRLYQADRRRGRGFYLADNRRGEKVLPGRQEERRGSSRHSG
jgi:hypothetical protein